MTETEVGPGVLKKIAENRKAANDRANRAEILSLTKLQRALLGMLYRDGLEFSPFSIRSRDALKTANGGRTPATSAIQKAIDVLREKGLVWRPSRGSYALEK